MGVISRHTKRFKESAWELYLRRLNWAVLVSGYEKQLLQEVEDAKIADFFERLYVEQRRDDRSVQLFAGQHPVGIKSKDTYFPTYSSDYEIIPEHGAALVISQAADGSVAIFIYPYKSDLYSRKERLICLGVYDSPIRIHRGVIEKAIDSFYLYIRISSPLFVETRWERFKISWLIFLSRRYTEETPFVIRSILNHSLVSLVVTFATFFGSVEGLHWLWDKV